MNASFGGKEKSGKLAATDHSAGLPCLFPKLPKKMPVRVPIFWLLLWTLPCADSRLRRMGAPSSSSAAEGGCGPTIVFPERATIIIGPEN